MTSQLDAPMNLRQALAADSALDSTERKSAAKAWRRVIGAPI